MILQRAHRRRGDVVIADTYDNAVRFIPATSGTYFGVAMTAHTIYPVAGDGVQYYGGNGGLGTSAYLNLPGGLRSMVRATSHSPIPKTT